MDPWVLLLRSGSSGGPAVPSLYSLSVVHGTPKARSFLARAIVAKPRFESPYVSRRTHDDDGQMGYVVDRSPECSPVTICTARQPTACTTSVWMYARREEEKISFGINK